MRILLGAALAAVALLAVGCGSSSTKSGGGGTGPGALSAEAQSAATGDIPDNQVFLTFSDRPAGYSMKYPEGWAQRGSGTNVTFADKNNLIHVTVGSGALPSPAEARAELTKLRASTPTLRAKSAQRMTISGAPADKLVYTTRSAPNPVTGKRVTLTVDRYVFAKGGRRATLDLGTPVGVDNVDAYRMISQSFRWR